MEVSNAEGSVVEVRPTSKFRSKRHSKKSRKKHLANLMSKRKERGAESTSSSNDKEQSLPSFDSAARGILLDSKDNEKDDGIDKDEPTPKRPRSSLKIKLQPRRNTDNTSKLSMSTYERYAIIDITILNESLHKLGVCKTCKKGSLIFKVEKCLALSASFLSLAITLNVV